MKIAKVKYRYNKTKNVPPFVDTIGECGCCGAMVMRNVYGADEERYECGAELDWSEEDATEQEDDWSDWDGEEAD